MNYEVTRSDMKKKLERLLKDQGGYYTLDDIVEGIHAGEMQSFVQGDTWIITRILKFPRGGKALDILFVVGELEEARSALPRLDAFAKEIGATKMASIAREGWGKFAGPGWKQAGIAWVKDI